MRCLIHKWSGWSDPFIFHRKEIVMHGCFTIAETRQEKECSKCGKVTTRRVCKGTQK